MKNFKWILLSGLFLSFLIIAGCGDEGMDPDPCDELIWYEDNDGDGLGNPDVTLMACEKPEGYVDNDDDDDDTGSQSALTPEEHKEVLQNEGLTLVNELEELEQSEATETLVSFRLFVETTAPENARVDPVENIVDRILSFTTREQSATEFAQNSDPESLEELWDEYKGTYSWNAAAEDWDYTAGGEVIAFLFPSRETSVTNNAALTIQNYEGVRIANNPLEEEYTGDLPTELLIDLVVDEVKEMEYSFSINYSSEGEPEFLTTSLFVNPFTLTYELTNTESVIGTGMSFKDGDTELLGADVEINGNFDDDVIEQAEELEDPTLVVADGSLEFRIMNVRFLGEMDFDNLYTEADAILAEEGEPGYDYEAGAEALEEALNEYISISTSYIDSGDPISEVEFYTFVETDEFFPEEKYIEVGGRLLFADGSKVDLEDYFEEGWEQIEDEIEALLDDVESDLG